MSAKSLRGMTYQPETMTAVTMSCAQCSRSIPTESAIYSSAGELLCPSCIEVVQGRDAAARVATARRKMEIAFGVNFALHAIAVGAVFATGRHDMLRTV